MRMNPERTAIRRTAIIGIVASLVVMVCLLTITVHPDQQETVHILGALSGGVAVICLAALIAVRKQR